MSRSAASDSKDWLGFQFSAKSLFNFANNLFQRSIFLHSRNLWLSYALKNMTSLFNKLQYIFLSLQAGLVLL